MRGRRLPEDRPARARDALRRRGVRRPDRAPRGTSRSTSRASAARRPGRLRRDPARRHVGCFQIESRAQMQTILRTRPENLDDITIQVALVRPGPIQGKAVHPYIERRQKLREDPSVRAARRPRAAARAAARDARRRRLPGPGARRRDPSRRLHRRRGGRAAARDEPQAQPRGARGVPHALRRRRAREGRRRGACAPGLRQARRVLGLRLPEVALRRVRAARVPVGVAAPPLRRRVPRSAAERAADGLLSAGDARARRAAPRHRDAAAGRERERRRLPHRGRRRSHRAEVRAGRGGGRRGGRRRERDANGPYTSIRALAQRTPLSNDELARSSSPARATLSA